MILTVENLSFAYPGGKNVLDGISFSMDTGEFLSVLGPNGVGKSTLFHCILGTYSNYKGKILLDGQELRTLSPRERSRLMAFIPQFHRPTFRYTVNDVVMMGLARTISPFSIPGTEQERKAAAALEQVGAEKLRERYFSQLSGGEQQLVLIARALAQDSRLLVMDEPTSALDYGNQFRILQLVRSLSAEGYSVLLSTHNPQHALSFAGKVLALQGGRVADFGPSAEVLTAQLLEQLYGIHVTLLSSPAGPVIAPLADAGV